MKKATAVLVLAALGSPAAVCATEKLGPVVPPAPEVCEKKCPEGKVLDLVTCECVKNRDKMKDLPVEEVLK